MHSGGRNHGTVGTRRYPNSTVVHGEQACRSHGKPLDVQKVKVSSETGNGRRDVDQKRSNTLGWDANIANNPCAEASKASTSLTDGGQTGSAVRTTAKYMNDSTHIISLRYIVIHPINKGKFLSVHTNLFFPLSHTLFPYIYNMD